MLLILASIPASVQGSEDILYGGQPPWVEAPVISTDDTKRDGGAHVRFNDTQVQITDSETTSFSTYRIALLQPEALQLGNLSIAWNPQSTNVTVNRLLVHRGAELIDVLKGQKFRIFQREGRLEQAMLDGLLTANLQIPGLRVGDEIEFAVTLNEHSRTFGQDMFGSVAIPPEVPPGTYRRTISWTKERTPRWRASEDLKPHLTVADTAVGVTLHNPAKFTPPDGAPQRYSVGRLLQFSTFKDWPELSRKTSSLFDTASQLPLEADLSARIDKIGALEGQQAKAVEALALVENSIRYVYTGMDGGDYVPASARDTWERRFGDCKGKSALLLGILRKLGIESEAVLVATNGGDGYDRYLPSPELFDHVLLRTVIDGRRYWLDGTRTGDPHLLADDEVPYRWVLPLSANGHDLQEIGYQPPKQPQELSFFEIDARAGTEIPASVKLLRVLRGDQALITHVALKGQTKEASRTGLLTAFKDNWLSPEDASWQFDPATGSLAITVTGTAKLEWEKDGDGPNLAIVGGGFYPPDPRERPKDQDQTAPYANTLGRFACSVTRMHLPKLPKGHWETGAEKIDQVIGGVAYYRQVNLKDGIVDLIRSSRTQLSEISSSAAGGANALIPKFDNSKVTAWTYKGSKAVSEISDPDMPDLAAVDWLSDGSPCLPKRER